MSKLNNLLDMIKRGMGQTPPAVYGDIPPGFTLDSYREAVQLGLFDNGASPSEVLEMMRQNGAIGKLEGLQYSDGTSDIDRRRAAIKEIVDNKNNLSDGTFLDTFPRYQENFQFIDGKPSNFRVRRDPDGYRSDAQGTYRERPLVQHEIPKTRADVSLMNMYGNGDFMNTNGLLTPNKINGGKPEYIMSNEFPTGDYIVDPSLKIRRAIESGELGASENVDGQLAGFRDWYENKPTNTNELYLDMPDDWDAEF